MLISLIQDGENCLNHGLVGLKDCHDLDGNLRSLFRPPLSKGVLSHAI